MTTHGHLSLNIKFCLILKESRKKESWRKTLLHFVLNIAKFVVKNKWELKGNYSWKKTSDQYFRPATMPSAEYFSITLKADTSLPPAPTPNNIKQNEKDLNWMAKCGL